MQYTPFRDTIIIILFDHQSTRKPLAVAPTYKAPVQISRQNTSVLSHQLFFIKFGESMKNWEL